jgi:transcriptional regulator with XRE-family HTH domain|tara:strand:- start:1543 stop:2130 length:588 start_codon:yes stop_codon:yes gene_type:complete
MMSNFQNTFNRLKKERQLSNKQVASFTGVKVKDVKKWETGMSFPTDSKVVDALEGILGTEILRSLEGFKTEENNFSSLTSSEDEIFKVNNEKLEISNTRIDRLRNIFQRETHSNNDFNYDSDFDTPFLDQEAPKEVLIDEEKNLEQPYLYDEKQLGFYLSRNIKTVGLLSVLGVIVISFFRLFWESLNLFINNIL